MSLVTQTVAMVTGIILLVAAVGKLDAWRSWKQKTRSWFGNRGVAAAVRRLLPAAEVTVALLCFARPFAGLIVAAALLSVFTAGTGYLAVRHRGEDCGCFGALMPSRIGWTLVLRNAAAAAVAAAVAIVAVGRDVPAANWRELVVASFVGVLVLAFAEFSQMMKSKGGAA